MNVVSNGFADRGEEELGPLDPRTPPPRIRNYLLAQPDCRIKVVFTSTLLLEIEDFLVAVDDPRRIFDETLKF